MNRRISVTGLGYVGLPVATTFAKAGQPVIAFDIDRRRVAELAKGHDRTGEVEPADLASPGLTFTADAKDLAKADFHIVTVPTPIDASKQPNLDPLRGASTTIGAHLKTGDIVVYESTVYPGVTEEVCIPALEKSSGLKWKTDFNVGYSPERINPGDKERRFDNILKIVSGDTPQTLDVVDAVYKSVISAGTHRAASIKIAEFAKVLENTQRDVNIALINEISLICDRLGVDTQDVLKAAGTKWNFLPFRPGLVGGHCIGVDPFYIAHKAEEVGYHLQGERDCDDLGEVDRGAGLDQVEAVAHPAAHHWLEGTDDRRPEPGGDEFAVAGVVGRIGVHHRRRRAVVDADLERENALGRAEQVGVTRYRHDLGVTARHPESGFGMPGHRRLGA